MNTPTLFLLAHCFLTPPAPFQEGSRQVARLYPDPNDLTLRDRFGEALDLDGATLLVADPFYDPAGGAAAQGAVFVFGPSDSTWVELARLGSSALDGGDRFGASVAIDGDTAVVGAPYDEAAGPAAAGAAFVFVRRAGVWSEEAPLLASDPGVFDHFGSAVAIEGDTVAVGANLDDAGSGFGGGSAYVFERSGTTWTQVAKLVASDSQAGDELGTSIALSGPTIVVGAPKDDSGAGSAYVFQRRGTAWQEEVKLTAADGAGGDSFGTSVAIDGATLVVGSPWSDTGAAYVFARSNVEWLQQAKLVDFGAAVVDRFGTAVDIEGDRIVVGLPYNHEGGLATGAVQLFVREDRTWTGRLEMIGSESDPNDFLGSSVAISGDLVAGGAPRGETPPTEVQTGEAYLFEIVPPALVESYCTGKPNSLGCVPRMSWTGAPSASNPTPFTLVCSDVLNYQSG